MSDADRRERLEKVMVNGPRDTELRGVFQDWQKWYADREETIEKIRDGGAVVGSSSCDMLELLDLAEKNDWVIEMKAGGVYYIGPDE